jgi:hypothetical protein
MMTCHGFTNPLRKSLSIINRAHQVCRIPEQLFGQQNSKLVWSNASVAEKYREPGQVMGDIQLSTRKSLQRSARRL